MGSTRGATVARIDRRRLVAHLHAQFCIDWQGHHGIPHWARVRHNGLLLARETGADAHVVELFAFFHDSRRFNEHEDDGHGARGAALAQQLEGRFFAATAGQMELLELACRGHSDGRRTGDVTVLTSWDADRLDLGRVGIRPDPRYLCTSAAASRATLEAAHARARAWRALREVRARGTG